jgi:hypothetical protein
MESKRNFRNSILILIVVLSSTLGFAQVDSTGKNISEKPVNLTPFDIHVGFVGQSGTRIGIRFFLSNHISFETSLGIPGGSFLYPTEQESRYGIGISWHHQDTSGLIVSMLASNVVKPNHVFPDIPNNRFWDYLSFSLNAGYYYRSSSNFMFFSRFGGGYDLVKKSNSSRQESHFWWPNIDIGIGWYFDFN